MLKQTNNTSPIDLNDLDDEHMPDLEDASS
jgi:hypothetical protein